MKSVSLNSKIYQWGFWWAKNKNENRSRYRKEKFPSHTFCISDFSNSAHNNNSKKEFWINLRFAFLQSNNYSRRNLLTFDHLNEVRPPFPFIFPLFHLSLATMHASPCIFNYTHFYFLFFFFWRALNTYTCDLTPTFYPSL